MKYVLVSGGKIHQVVEKIMRLTWAVGVISGIGKGVIGITDRKIAVTE